MTLASRPPGKGLSGRRAILNEPEILDFIRCSTINARVFIQQRLNAYHLCQ